MDAHGEATSEKIALGHMVDGRASMLVGTHTHVPTADHRILPGGTAYQTDVGMCGDYDSVIGMNKEAATDRFTGRGNSRLSVALGVVTTADCWSRRMIQAWHKQCVHYAAAANWRRLENASGKSACLGWHKPGASGINF